MPAVPKDLYIEQGATFALGFNWHRESDPVTDPPTAGEPYDLAGCVARMEIRKAQQVTALVSATSDGPSPMITLGAGGRVDVKLTDEATDQLVFRTAVYDLEVELLNGDVRRLLSGTVTISPNVTQLPGDPVVE